MPISVEILNFKSLFYATSAHFSPLVLSTRAMAPISGEKLNFKSLFSRGMLLPLHFSPLVLSPRAMAPISGEILK